MKKLLLLILLALGLSADAQQTCFGSSCSSSGSSTITPSTPTSGFTANTLIRTDGTNFLSGPKYASTGDLSLLFGVNRCMDSGGSDAYSCALSGGSLTAYGTGGLQITLRATTANTGTATLDVDSLGAKTITRSDGTTLQTGDITAGMYVGLVYDGTNFRASFRSGSIISPAGGVTIRSDTYASGSDVGLTVQGSLTGNIQEWKTSAGAALGSVSVTGALVQPAGSSGSPSYRFTGSATRGWYDRTGTGGWTYSLNSAVLGLFPSCPGSLLCLESLQEIAWSSGAVGAAEDLFLYRKSAGVLRIASSSTNTVALLGGGAAVASATAMPLPTGRVFHVTGTTNITSITSTNFANGAVITLIFDGVLTFTDGGNLKLEGDFVTTADDTITLVYDGTNWYEASRRIN